MLSTFLASLLCPQSDLRAGLQKDYAILHEAYTALHPGLYRYNSATEMEENFEVLQKGWLNAPNRREAFLRLSEFTAKVKCGHTYPNFFNQGQEVVTELFEGQNRVPFHFRWLGKKMVVTQDLTPSGSLPRGSVIRAIDGIPTGQMLKTLIKVARADGGNDAKRLAILSVTGESRYEAFDIYFPLYFNLPSGALTFTILDPAGKSRVVKAQALSMKDRVLDSKAQRARGKDGVPWALSFPRKRTALLRMPTWAIYKDKWDWKEFLAKSFQELEDNRVGSLIIDLTGNEGGANVGDELISHLTTQDPSTSLYKTYTRFRTAPKDLKPYFDTWDPTFYDWSKYCEATQNIQQGKQSYFRMKLFDAGEDGKVVPKPAIFKGKVAVLIDGSNSSATFLFAQKIRMFKLGTLIGEPTGGNQRGINGSAFYFLTLPNSKLEVDLPLCAQFAESTMPDAGLIPDIPCNPTVQDIADGRNLALVAAIRFLENRSGIR